MWDAPLGTGGALRLLDGMDEMQRCPKEGSQTKQRSIIDTSDVVCVVCAVCVVCGADLVVMVAVKH